MTSLTQLRKRGRFFFYFQFLFENFVWKTWLPWCQDEGPSSHSCYYVGWSRKAPSWQKLRKLEQNTKVFWVCGLIFIVLSGLVSQCGPFTRDDQLGPFFVVSVLLVLTFKNFCPAKNGCFYYYNFLLVQCYGKDAAGSVQGNKWSKWGGDPGRQGGKKMNLF